MADGEGGVTSPPANESTEGLGAVDADASKGNEGSEGLGAAWHDSIENEALKTAAEGFESRDKMLEALGAKDKGKDKGKDGAEGAPESYTDFTLPEGVKVNEELIGPFHELGQKHGLAQEAMQDMINLQIESAKADQEAHTKAFVDLKAGWLDTVKKDPEIGGQRFDETLELGKKAMQEFAPPEMGQILREYGLGVHPAIMKFARNVGAALAEDGVLSGGGGTSGERGAAERMFGGTMGKKS